MIPDLILAIVAGASGGLVAAVTRLGSRRGRRVVPLEVGQRIAEPDGREWTVVRRAMHVEFGRAPSLTIDLGLRSDPS